MKKLFDFNFDILNIGQQSTYFVKPQPFFDPRLATVTGTSGDDTLDGTNNPDTIYGGDGNDTIYGMDKRDYIYGGNDNDLIYGGQGRDIIYGEAGDDTVYGETEDDQIFGGDGDDDIYSGDGVDTIEGGAGNDLIDTGESNDVIYGGAGNDTISSGNANDTIYDGEGDDIIDAGAGNDLLYAGDGADAIDGGADTDTLTYVSSTAGVTLYMDGTVGTGGFAQGDTLANIEFLIGSDFDDTVYGTSSGETIQTRFGVDHIYGGGGADSIDMGGGNDVFHYIAGEDYTGATINGGAINGEFSDVMLLDGGNSSAVFDLSGASLPYMNIFEFAGTTSGTLIIQQAGQNFINGFTASGARTAGQEIDITVNSIPNMTNVTYTGLIDGFDTITLQAHSFTQFRGSSITAFGEQFIATGGANNMYGYGGDDYFETVVGGDLIYGGEGNDTIVGGNGNNNRLYGDEGDDSITGNTLYDLVYGGDGIDTIDTAAGNDTIYGGAGNDDISGGEGNDTIYDGEGDDIVDAGAGSDTVYAGEGADQFDGGADSDTIRYTDSTSGVTLWLDGSMAGVGGYAQGDILSNFETYYGSNQDDIFYDTAGDDTVYGQNGADQYFHSGGADFVNLGSGLDVLTLMSGSDYTGATFNGGNDTGNTLRLDNSDMPGVFDLTTGDFSYFSALEFAGLTSGTFNIVASGNLNFSSITASGARPIAETVDINIFAENFYRNVNLSTTTLTGLTSGVDTITITYHSFATFQGSNTVAFNESFIAQSGRGASNIYAYGGEDYIQGSYGNDTIYAGDGNDTVIGGDTVGSTIRGEAGIDTLNGGDQGDTIYGGDNADLIDGEIGNDSLYGGAGDDQVNGSAGDDLLYGDAGADQIDGGDGFDTIYYTDSAAGVTVYLDGSQAGSGGDAQGDVLTNIERYYGSGLDDVFYDTAGDDNVFGQGGADSYHHSGGADSVNLNGGADNLVLQSGTDYTGASFNGGNDTGNTLQLDGNDMPGTFDLTTGSFTYFQAVEFLGTTSGTFDIVMSSTLGFTSFTASGSRPVGETIDINLITNNFYTNINLSGTTYTGLISGEDTLTITYHSFATFRGSDVTPFAESFIAQSGRGASNLYGYGGDDFFQGSYGQDSIYAGTGNDTVIGGDIGSTIRGEDGNDDLTGGIGNDTIYGGADDDVIHGGDGNDVIYDNAGADTVFGEDGNDTIYAGDNTETGVDDYDGGDGTDYISFYENQSGAISIYADGTVSTGETAVNFESYRLTDFQDTFYGSSADETVTAEGENDVIYHGGGADTVYGGSGDDQIFTEAGNDVTGAYFDAGAGMDSYIFDVKDGSTIDMTVASSVRNLDDIIIAGDNANGEVRVSAYMLDSTSLSNDAQSVTISGARTSGAVRFTILSDGAGVDFRTVNLQGFDTTVDTLSMIGLGSASETFYGTQSTAFDEIVEAGAGNDTIYTFGGDDVIDAGDGDDIVYGAEGADDMDGGLGVDQIVYSASGAGVTVDLATGVASGGTASGDTVLNFEDLTGSDFRDVVSGNSAANTLLGRGGNDELSGLEGDDLILGGDGVDTLDGGDGADELRGQAGRDTVYGGAGDDTIQGNGNLDFLYGGAGNDFISGGNGQDVIEGGSGDDAIFSGVGNDSIIGEGGNDEIYGGGSNDDIDGGDGNDILSGGGGNDVVYGGAGMDTINGNNLNDMLYGGADNDLLDGDGGLDTLYGGTGDDTLRGEGGGDYLYGDEGADELFGGSGFDYLYGGADDDVITGSGGGDILDGGAGQDALYGGAGVDDVIGGAGDDMLSGGGGLDTFFFADDFGTDVILDFRNNELIDFSAHSDFNSFGDVLAAASQVGSDVHIVLDALNTLILENFNVVGLDAHEFAF